MKHFLQEISFETTDAVEFIDLTKQVQRAFAASGIKDGLVTIFTRHTTTAVKINERCGRLQQDMLAFLECAVPDANYRHNSGTVDGRKNARSHLMSLLLNASETVPAAKGELMLGEWQSIFFIELDGPRGQRSVFVRIIGE